MRTKLFKPELALDCDDTILEFVEAYESNELLPEYKVAIAGTDPRIQYRSVVAFGEDAFYELKEVLDGLDLINRLDNPPHKGYHAIYTERDEYDIL